MKEYTMIFFTNPAFRDGLSASLRRGAQGFLRQAVEAALGVFSGGGYGRAA